MFEEPVPEVEGTVEAILTPCAEPVVKYILDNNDGLCKSVRLAVTTQICLFKHVRKTGGKIPHQSGVQGF